MLDDRRIHPYLKIAIAVVVGCVIFSQLIRYALLPTAIVLVGWGAYQIFKTERRGIPTSLGRRGGRPKRPKRSLKIVKSIRLDPKRDLTVPKDWR